MIIILMPFVRKLHFFLEDYSKLIGISWLIVCFIRIWLNDLVYKKTENNTLNEARVPHSNNVAPLIMSLFTFWFNDYKYEDDLAIRKLMKRSDLAGVFLILYSFFLISLFVFDNYTN